MGCSVFILECTNLTQNLMPQGWRFCSKSKWCDSIEAALQHLKQMEKVAAGSPHFLHVLAGCNKASKDGWELTPVYPDVGLPRLGSSESQYQAAPSMPHLRLTLVQRSWAASCSNGGRKWLAALHRRPPLPASFVLARGGVHAPDIGAVWHG